MITAVFFVIFLGLVDTADVVSQVLDGFFCDLLERVADMYHTIAMNFMTNFAPDIDQYLKMFGYSGSDFSAFAWTQTSSDAVVNMCSIFAICGYILAIAILVTSLLKAAMSNVVESRETPMVLLIRFVLTFIIITYSNSIIGVLLKVTKSLWDWMYDTDKLTTIDASNSNLGSIDIVSLHLLLGLIFAIVIIVELFKMILEIIEKFLLVGFLYLCFPLVSATLVSRTTSNVVKAYLRMMISELFLMLMNVWFVSMLNVLVLNVGNNELGIDSFTQCVIVISFEKLAQNIDVYMRNLGLNTAVTGGNLLDSILLAANNIMAAPGRAARSANAIQQAATGIPAQVSRIAATHGFFNVAAKAADASTFMGGDPGVAESVAEAAMRASKGLTPDQVQSAGVQGAVLSSAGKVDAATVGSAIELGGGDAIRDALANAFEVTGGTNGVKLGKTALWNPDDNAWHMRSEVGGETIPLQIAQANAIPPDKNVLATFKDNNGVEWGAIIDSKAMQTSPDRYDAIQRAAKNGVISNPYVAEALTGIGNKYGIKVNPDHSYTLMGQDGIPSNARFVPTGKPGEYIRVYDDSFLAGKMGFGTGFYNGKTAADYVAQGGIISDPVAAKAVSGLDNDYGLYVYKAPDGQYRYRDLNADGEYFGGPIDASQAPNILRKADGQVMTETGTPVTYSVDEAMAMGAAFPDVFGKRAEEAFGDQEHVGKSSGSGNTSSGPDPVSGDVHDNIQGIQVNENGTFSTIDNDGNTNTTQYLFGMDNPYGVKDEGDNNFAIYGGIFGDEEVQHIHVNDNGTVSYYDDDGQLGDEQYLTNVPGMEDTPVHEADPENQPGVFVPNVEEEAEGTYFFADRAGTTLSMENIEDDHAGGYYANMVTTGTFVDKSDVSDSGDEPQGFAVHIKPVDAVKAGEQEISTFEDTDTHQQMGVYATQQDLAAYMQKNAGRDIQNATIGNALMCESAETIDNIAEQAGIQTSTVYHISDGGTTIGRMSDEYAHGALEDAETGPEYYSGGVFTKYDDDGNKLYTYADGPQMKPIENLHSKPSTFATGFDNLHLEDDERITDVKAFRPKEDGSPRNYRITVSNVEDIPSDVDVDSAHDTCEGTYRSFFDARNLPEDYHISKENSTILTDHNGYVLVETPGKQLWTKEEKQNHSAATHYTTKKTFRNTNGQKLDQPIFKNKPAGARRSSRSSGYTRQKSDDSE